MIANDRFFLPNLIMVSWSCTPPLNYITFIIESTYKIFYCQDLVILSAAFHLLSLVVRVELYLLNNKMKYLFVRVFTSLKSCVNFTGNISVDFTLVFPKKVGNNTPLFQFLHSIKIESDRAFLLLNLRLNGCLPLDFL